VSAQFYVKRARSDVTLLRARLRALGLDLETSFPIDIDQIASLAGDCEIVRISDLTENNAIRFLRAEYNLDTTNVAASDSSLAGALCVAEGASLRWILIRSDDSPARQRFSVAHELGHLFVEVESTVRSPQSSFALITERRAFLRVFSRCSEASVEPSYSRERQPPAQLSSAALSEIRAHHFAAEVLMPYDDLRTLIKSYVGSRGIRTKIEMQELTGRIVDRYGVSWRAARNRLEKDLAIVPIEDDPNTDLFA
jgi:Zn-dependent peptidase ImmA (M78 family)